jgi:2'-5' RNA ligase
MSHDPRTLQNLFIALLPDSRAQVTLQKHRATWTWPAEAWLPRPERLHLTVCWLQGVPAELVPRLRQRLHEVPMRPFDVVLRTPMVFRGEDGPAVIVPDRSEGLLQLRASLDRMLEPLGYQAPALSCPHVTLAWRSRNATPPPNTRPIAWHVSEFALIWSKPGHDLPDGGYMPAHHDVLEVCGANEARLPPLPVQASLFG